MTRSQFDALFRDQIDKGLVFRRQVLMHRSDHFLVALRAGYLEHLRMPIENFLRLGAQATGDDHLAVLGEGLADRIQRLIHRRIDETASVNYHQVRGGIARRHFISFRAQAGEDALGIDQCFGAAQTDKAHLGALAFDGFHAISTVAKGAELYSKAAGILGLQFEPKRPINRGQRPFGRPFRHFALSNSFRVKSATWLKQNPPQDGRRRLKNPRRGPIKTLNVSPVRPSG